MIGNIFEIEIHTIFKAGGDFHGKREKKGTFLYGICDKHGNIVRMPLLFWSGKRRNKFERRNVDF